MRFFYTFGSDPQFPFGSGEYIVIYGETELDADRKFRNRFPNRPGSSCLNCAFVYNESEWSSIEKKYYRHGPALVIE